MLCDVCSSTLRVRVASLTNPYVYELSGLDDIRLSGVKIHRCRKCKTETPMIPRIAELHRVIARILLNKPGRLKGQEIRFLRKFAGKSSQQFAELVGVDPATLSRAECDKRAFGASADKLVRVIAGAVRHMKESNAVALMAPQPARDTIWRQVTLEPTDSTWQEAAAGGGR